MECENMTRNPKETKLNFWNSLQQKLNLNLQQCGYVPTIIGYHEIRRTGAGIRVNSGNSSYRSWNSSYRGKVYCIYGIINYLLFPVLELNIYKYMISSFCFVWICTFIFMDFFFNFLMKIHASVEDSFKINNYSFIQTRK